MSETTEQLGVFVSASKLLKQTLNKSYLIGFEDNKNDSISSGFHAIDQLTGGFKPGELTTIAVRPGIGKTAFLLSLINNIAVCHNVKAGVFSLERSAKKIFTRMLESATGQSLNKINKNRLTQSQKNLILPVLKNFADADFYIDDNAKSSVEEIMEKTRVMAANGIRIIFIDYLELLKSSLKSKDRACNKEPLCPIIHALKDLAVEMNIPIVLFSQLAKPVVYNNRFKYTPDFVNETTDVLLFLNRPDYYHINELNENEKGMAEVTVAKVGDDTEFKLAQLRFIESLDVYTNPA